MADDNDPAKNQPTGYVPPKVWTWDKENGGQFAGINAPTAGARFEQELPRRQAPDPALFAGHAQWRQGHHHARGAAGTRPQRCGI